jgi:hypothetical protein
MTRRVRKLYSLYGCCQDLNALPGALAGVDYFALLYAGASIVVQAGGRAPVVQSGRCRALRLLLAVVQ